MLLFHYTYLYLFVSTGRRSLKRKLSPALRSHKLETMTDLFGGSQDEEEDESLMTVVVGGHQDEVGL